MSRKHLIKHYENVCKQYDEFVQEIKDFEECVANGVVAPETIDNIQTMLEPLKNNWMTMNYIMYLLNLPNKKEKQDRYHKQNKNKLENCITDKDVYKENDECIKTMQDFTDDIRRKA